MTQQRLAVNWFVFFRLGKTAKIGIVRGKHQSLWVVEDGNGSGVYADVQLTPLFMAEGEVDMKAILPDHWQKIVDALVKLGDEYSVLAEKLR